MWSRLRRLGLKMVSRRTNVSSQSHLRQNPQRLGLRPMRLGSRLGLEAICLGLSPVGLISGLGPLRLVETFCAGPRRAYCSCSVCSKIVVVTLFIIDCRCQKYRGSSRTLFSLAPVSQKFTIL